jgi:hypothetical protein
MVKGEIDLKMHVHLLYADLGKLCILRPEEVLYGYGKDIKNVFTPR